MDNFCQSSTRLQILSPSVHSLQAAGQMQLLLWETELHGVKFFDFFKEINSFRSFELNIVAILRVFIWADGEYSVAFSVSCIS